MIPKVAESPGWADHALDLGWKVACVGPQNVKQRNESPWKRPCHLCDADTPFEKESVIDYILAKHHA